MARIKSYVQDTNVTDQDRILGTSYEGLLNNKPIYKTRNYKVTDLAKYFSKNFDVDGVNYDLSLISETITQNTFAIATANQSLTVLTNDVIAQATFQTNLAAIFGTVDDQGNLITLAQSFADQILQATSSARYATAVFATGLASSFGTYDTETGELTGISQAFADSVITTTASDRFAESSSVTSLESTVGNIPRIFSQDEPPPLDSPIGSIWFDTNDGNKRYVLVGGDPNFWQENRDTEFTQFKATAEEELITLATDTSATAQKITNLNAVLEILDENGDLIPLNQAEYFNTITTYVDENSATAFSLTELTATVEDNKASITDNEQAIVSKPNVYRQTEEPTGTIPLKSVWYDTDDNNKPYVYELSGWVEARDGKVVELETYALAQKTLEADANGIITGITIKSENSGDAAPPISDITFKTNTFNIVDQSNNQKLALDASGNLTINGGGTFTGSLTGASGTFGTVTLNSSGISGVGFTLGASGLSLTSGSVSLGNSVILDSDGLRGQGFELDSTGITANNGTFSGTFTAGDVSITNNRIEVDGGSGSLVFTEGATQYGSIIGSGGFLTIDADNFVSISSSTGSISTGAGGLTIGTTGSLLANVNGAAIITLGTGLTLNGSLIVNQPVSSSFNGQGTGTFGVNGMTVCSIVAPDTIITSSSLFSVQSGTILFTVDPSGVKINGSPILNSGNISNQEITIAAGGPLGGGGAFTLNQGSPETITITHDTSPQGSTGYSGGTVIQNFSTDGYGHITGVTPVNLDGRYLTSLPSHNHNDLYYTENEINNLLTGYATVAYVNGAVPTSTQESQWTAAYNFSVFGGTVSGNIYANDFILNSDASLKENVVDYAVKPINIAYKEYSFVGTQDKRVGVIAQELEVEHPEFIRESGLGKKSVSYIDLLLAKVAELEARIKQLEDGSTS